jgi:hypothetical protein
MLDFRHFSLSHVQVVLNLDYFACACIWLVSRWIVCALHTKARPTIHFCFNFFKYFSCQNGTIPTPYALDNPNPVRTIPVFFVYSMYAERPIHSFYLDFLFGSYSFFICILFVVLLVFICIDIASIRRLGGNGEW